MHSISFFFHFYCTIIEFFTFIFHPMKTKVLREKNYEKKKLSFGRHKNFICALHVAACHTQLIFHDYFSCYYLLINCIVKHSWDVHSVCTQNSFRRIHEEEVDKSVRQTFFFLCECTTYIIVDASYSKHFLEKKLFLDEWGQFCCIYF